MRLLKYLTVLGFVSLLSGCVAEITPALKNDAAPNSANGVIAGQFTRAKTADIAFIVRNIGTGQEYPMVLGENSTTSVTDEVVAIELPPGDYTIAQGEFIATLTKRRYGSKFSIVTPYLASPFKVTAGQVTFLGNFLVGFQGGFIQAKNTSLANARTAFVGTYPRYGNYAFACQMCSEAFR